jgi:hypothetical protein
MPTYTYLNPWQRKNMVGIRHTSKDQYEFKINIKGNEFLLDEWSR